MSDLPHVVNFRLAVPATGLAAVSFPHIFERFAVRVRLRGGSGAKKILLVIHNQLGEEVGKSPSDALPLGPTTRIDLEDKFDLHAAAPGRYVASLVIDGNTLAQQRFHIRQIPSIQAENDGQIKNRVD
jgi:hypothetical protein